MHSYYLVFVINSCCFRWFNGPVPWMVLGHGCRWALAQENLIIQSPGIGGQFWRTSSRASPALLFVHPGDSQTQLLRGLWESHAVLLWALSQPSETAPSLGSCLRGKLSGKLPVTNRAANPRILAVFCQSAPGWPFFSPWCRLLSRHSRVALVRPQEVWWWCLGAKNFMEIP